MKTYGLLGKSLGHSFSRDYFSKKFQAEETDAQYLNFELPSIDSFPKLIEDHQPDGLNVTIPYKEEIIPFLDDLDDVAKKVGAVNTIKIQGSRLIGFNTDVTGFEFSLKPFLEHGMEKALILGTGGASKAVEYVLKNLGIDVLFVSRSPKGENQISYEDCNENAVKWHRLIVNTTPLGTYPDIEERPPIAYEGITEGHLLYDLIYNPEKTKFLEEGTKRGAQIINGLSMLKIQAEKSYSIWQSEA